MQEFGVHRVVPAHLVEKEEVYNLPFAIWALKYSRVPAAVQCEDSVRVCRSDLGRLYSKSLATLLGLRFPWLTYPGRLYTRIVEVVALDGGGERHGGGDGGGDAGGVFTVQIRRIAVAVA